MSQREYAYDNIRDSITYGELRPGERLTEERLCKLFEIGRTPLREALSQLQIEGYLDLIPNKGVTVTKISVSDLKEIYDILAILEGYATELATDNLNAEDKKQIGSLHKELKKASAANDYETWTDKNQIFHECLARCSGNNHLYKLILSQRRRIYRYRLITSAIRGSIQDYFQSHEEILDAICKGEKKRAGRLMQKHMFKVSEILVEFMTKIPAL